MAFGFVFEKPTNTPNPFTLLSEQGAKLDIEQILKLEKMKASQDIISHPADKQTIHQQFSILERQRDFLEWLFDKEVDYMTQDEAWNKFEQYEKNKEKLDEFEK